MNQERVAVSIAWTATARVVAVHHDPSVLVKVARSSLLSPV